MIPTPHIEAKDKNEIADSILLPGDPLRAKFIADNFLSDVKQFNCVRNAFGYTGNYKGQKVSVMGTGMGMPSMSIYSYELINFYDTKRLIRVGSCGSYQKNVNLRDIIIATGACTNSNYMKQFGIEGNYSAIPSYSLIEKAVNISREMKINVKTGTILSSDIFYNNDKNAWKNWAELNVLAVEMEAYALFVNAAINNAEALCILTVSDSIITGEKTTSKEREQSFTDMMKIALDTAIS